MSFVPGLGIAKGMALTLRRFFEPKATIQYPETQPDVAVRFRGRLQLLYDECGQSQVRDVLPVRPGVPGRVHRHGRLRHDGPLPRPLGRGRDVRRAARGIGHAALRPARPGSCLHATSPSIDVAAVDRIAAEFDFDPKRTLPILEAIEVGVRLSAGRGAQALQPDFRGARTRCSTARRATTAISISKTRARRSASAPARPAPSPAPARSPGHSPTELGTEVGRKPETGHLALEYLPVHIAGAASPLIALDGAPQEVTRAGAAAWVRALASGAAAGAASAKPAGARRRAAGPERRHARTLAEAAGMTNAVMLQSPAALPSSAPARQSAVQSDRPGSGPGEWLVLGPPARHHRASAGGRDRGTLRLRDARPRLSGRAARRQVGVVRPRPGRPQVRRRQRVPVGSGGPDGPHPHRAQSIRRLRGRGDRRVHRRGAGDHLRRADRSHGRHPDARIRDRHRPPGGLSRRQRPWHAAWSFRRRFEPSRAPTCSARKRSCSRASKAGAANPSSSRRTPRPAASSASQRSSTDPRPSPRYPRS